MVLVHLVYALDLIALTLGTGLFIWSKQSGCCHWLGKLVGLVVMVLAVLSIVCTYSCAMKGSECHGPGRMDSMMMGAPAATDGAAAERVKGSKK